MRSFIAVEVPAGIQKKVGEYIDSISGLVHDVKWVSEKNLHFTIKFLGEIDDEVFCRVKECVERVAAEYSSFTMGISGVGFFPAEEHPKVVWIGADGGVDTLLYLFQDMERCLEHIGFDRESKTFSPHLTIGRAKKFKKVTIPAGLPDFETVMFDVGSIVIMKSTLTPDGPIYEKLFECGLKPADED